MLRSPASRGPSGRDPRDAEPAGEISGAREASRRICGAPEVFAELRRRGERTSRKRVARIMRENGRAGATRGCARRPEGGAEQAAPRADSAPGLVRRGFSADGPSGAWFAGIACVRAPGVALPGGRDGHMVREDRRLVDVGPHDGRARRWRAGDTVNLLFTICANESAPIALTYFHRFRQRFSTVFGYSVPLLSRGRSFSR